MLTYPYNTNTNLDRLRRIIVPYDKLIDPINQVLELAYTKNFKNFVVESIPYCLINKKYWNFIEKNYRTTKEAYFIG